MASSIQPLFSMKADSGAEGNTKPLSGDPIHKDAFLKLLIAQVRHQNPLNPTDGVEFLAQLTQFTQLEQTIAMREELEQIREAMTKPAAAAGE